MLTQTLAKNLSDLLRVETDFNLRRQFRQTTLYQMDVPQHLLLCLIGELKVCIEHRLDTFTLISDVLRRMSRQQCEDAHHLLERLEQAFRQLQRFTADASHELRTPLAAIRTISEVALEKPTSAEAYQEALSNVLEESSRLNQTIDSLMLLARAESTRADDTQPIFLFSDLATEVIGLLEVLGEERGARIVQEHPELAIVEIHADRALMRIALMNVVHNALKFSPRDSAIAIGFAQPAAFWLQISIQDEGPGIPSGEHARVFDRFFTSIDRSAANITGVGLGLSISKLVVERAGGCIAFDEHFHRGARCAIDLPFVTSAT